MPLNPEDSRQHGYTTDCPGCVSLRDGTSVRARRNHSDDCRTRMEGIIGGDRVRRAEARRERELDERLQQEDTRIGREAADAPASAQPTSTPRSRADSGIVEDRPIRQSETRGVDERQSSPTRRPADSAQASDRRKVARSTPQVDDSWSPNSKRYRGLPAGTTQADYQAWMRANRFPS
jgi:hypothetical protein